MSQPENPRPDTRGTRVLEPDFRRPANLSPTNQGATNRNAMNRNATNQGPTNLGPGYPGPQLHGPAYPGPRPQNTMRARLAVVASVVSLSAVITGPAWWRAGHQAERTSYLTPLVSAASSSAAARSNTGPPTTSPPSAALPADAVAVQGTPLCGTSVPVSVYAPPGYRGPLPGPAQGAAQPDLPGQLVAHWTGSAGAVEIRWPAAASSSHATVPVEGHGSSLSVGEGGPGGPLVVGTMLLKEHKHGCRAMRLALYGRVPAGLIDRLGADATGDPTFDAVASLVTDPATPLVAAHKHVNRLPSHAVACRGSAVPTRSGRVTGTRPESDPRAALRAFLEPAGHATSPVRAGRGYRELVDDSGRIAYGKPFAGGEGYVALVRMTHRGGGWVVTRWEVSGC